MASSDAGTFLPSFHNWTLPLQNWTCATGVSPGEVVSSTFCDKTFHKTCADTNWNKKPLFFTVGRFNITWQKGSRKWPLNLATLHLTFTDSFMNHIGQASLLQRTCEEPFDYNFSFQNNAHNSIHCVSWIPEFQGNSVTLFSNVQLVSLHYFHYLLRISLNRNPAPQSLSQFFH